MKNIFNTWGAKNPALNTCLGSARTPQSASGRIVCLRQQMYTCCCLYVYKRKEKTQMSSTLIVQTAIENTAFACSNSTLHRAQEYAIRPRLCQGSPQCEIKSWVKPGSNTKRAVSEPSTYLDLTLATLWIELVILKWKSMLGLKIN